MIAWWNEPDRWVTPREFARIYERSLRTVQWWCYSGTLADFGIQTYKDHRRHGGWLIRMPD